MFLACLGPAGQLIARVLLIKYGPYLRERSPISLHEDEVQAGTEWEKFHGKEYDDEVSEHQAVFGSAAEAGVRREGGTTDTAHKQAGGGTVSGAEHRSYCPLRGFPGGDTIR
jgi:hypothetical protein